jgi:hypothetical protein
MLLKLTPMITQGLLVSYSIVRILLSTEGDKSFLFSNASPVVAYVFYLQVCLHSRCHGIQSNQHYMCYILICSEPDLVSR